MRVIFFLAISTSNKASRWCSANFRVLAAISVAIVPYNWKSKLARVKVAVSAVYSITISSAMFLLQLCSHMDLFVISNASLPFSSRRVLVHLTYQLCMCACSTHRVSHFQRVIPGLIAIYVNVSLIAFPELTPGLISRCNPNMFLSPGDDKNGKKSYPRA